MTTLEDELKQRKKFSNANEFSLYIEERVNSTDLSYMDAILEYVDEADIDIEAVKPLINKSLKEKIHNEAVEKNYFKSKTGKLPL
jgi:hypothetical protein